MKELWEPIKYVKRRYSISQIDDDARDVLPVSARHFSAEASSEDETAEPDSTAKKASLTHAISDKEIAEQFEIVLAGGGGDCNVRDKNDWTPLHVACSSEETIHVSCGSCAGHLTCHLAS